MHEGIMHNSELAAKEERMATLRGGQILRQYCNKRTQKRQTEMCTPAVGMDMEKDQSLRFTTMSPIKVRDSGSVTSPEPIKVKSLADSKLSTSQTQVIVRKFSLPPYGSAKPKQRWKQLCNLQHEMTTTLPMSSVKILRPSTPLTREYRPGTLQSYPAGTLDVMNSTSQEPQTLKKVDLDSSASSKEENSVHSVSRPVNIKTVTSDDILVSKIDDVSVEEILDMAEEIPEVAAVAEVSNVGGTIKFGPFETAYSNIGMVGGKFMIFQPFPGTKHVSQQEGGNSKVNMIVLKSPQGAAVEAVSGRRVIKSVVGEKEMARSLLKTSLMQGSVKAGSELSSKEHGAMQENLKYNSEPTMKERNVVWGNLKHNSQFVNKEQHVEQTRVKHNSEPDNKQQNVVQENLKSSSDLCKNEQNVKLRSCKNNTESASEEQIVTYGDLKHGCGPRSGDQNVVSCGNLKSASERSTKEQNIVAVHQLPQEYNCLKVAQDGLQDTVTEPLQATAVVAPQQTSAQNKNSHVAYFDTVTEHVSADQKQLQKLQLEILMMKRRQNIAMHVERNVLRAKELKLVQEVMLPARKVLLSEMGTQTNLFSLVEPGRMVEMTISADKPDEPGKMVSSKIKPVTRENNAVMQKPSGYVLNSGSLQKIVLSGSGRKLVARAGEQDDRGSENNIFPSSGVITVSDGPDKKRVRLDVTSKAQSNQEACASSDTRTTHISSDTVSVGTHTDVANMEFQNASQHKKSGVNIVALNSSVETSKAGTLHSVKACKNVDLPVRGVPGVTNLQAANKSVKCGPLFSLEKDRKSVYDIIVQHNIAAHVRKSQLKQKVITKDVRTNENRAAPMVYFPDSNLFSAPRNINTQETAVRITKGFLQQAYEDWAHCCIPDENGNIPLHRAVINENLTLVKRHCVVLCGRKSKLDIHNFDKETPLHLAVLTGNAEITNMLLSFGAQASVKDSNGNTALHLAVLHGNLGCVEAILNTNSTKSLPLDDFNDEGYSPLHLCALNGRVEEMKSLIMKGAEVNLKDAKSGRTPLFHAVEANNCDLVQLLLACDANPNEANFCGHTPLTAASEISFAFRNTTEEYSASDGINFSSKLVPLSRGSNVTHTVDEESEIVFEGELFGDVDVDEMQKSDLAAQCYSTMSSNNNSNNPWFLND